MLKTPTMARHALAGVEQRVLASALDEHGEPRRLLALLQQPVQRAPLHVGIEAHHLARRRRQRHVERALPAFEHLHAHRVADVQAELVGQAVGHHQAVVLDAADLAVALVDDACQLRAPRQPADLPPLAPVAVDEAHRHVAARLDGGDAWQARHAAARRVVVGRLGHPDDDVAPHADVELRVDDEVDRVAKEVAHDDDRHRRCHAADRQRGAPRPALHVAQDHAQGRPHHRDDRREAHALDQRAPVVPRRRRAHRFGRRQPRGGEDRVQRAEHRGDQRDAQADEQQPRLDAVLEAREVEELGVQAGEHLAQGVADGHAEHHAEGDDDEHQLEVMRGDGAVRIAQRLQRRDLLALRGDEARDDDVEQEGRHAEKDRRQHGAQHLLFLDLVGEHCVRRLVFTAVRFAATVARELRRQRIDDSALRRARRELHRHAVERAFHVVGGGQRFARHPEHADAAQVGHAHQPGEDVLGRQRDADDLQRAVLAVDQRADTRAGSQPTLFGKARRDQRGDGIARQACVVERAATVQRDAVHRRWRAQIDADQLADDRIGDAVEVDAHHLLDGGLHVGHAGCGAQCVGQRVRRALDGGEDIGKTALRIETVARPVRANPPPTAW